MRAPSTPPISRFASSIYKPTLCIVCHDVMILGRPSQFEWLPAAQSDVYAPFYGREPRNECRAQALNMAQSA
jgi:hypothetical protein